MQTITIEKIYEIIGSIKNWSYSCPFKRELEAKIEEASHNP